MFPMPTIPAQLPVAAPQVVQAPAAPVSAPVVAESHGFRYTVGGNTLLGAGEVQAALARAATPAQAVAALKQAYVARGYFLVAVAAGVRGQAVRISVTQGRLAHVEGPPALTAYFDGLLGRDTLRTPAVVRRDLLAQAYAATEGQQPKIAFVPAAETGASTLRVEATPLEHAHTASGSLSIGNLGNRYAGHDLVQVQGQLRHRGYTLQASHSRALTGFDADSRGAYYAATGITLSKVTPAGWFQLDGTRTRYRLGTAFAPLDPGGQIDMFGGSATQLLYADATRRWTLAEGLHRIRDRETVFDGAYALRDQRYDTLDIGSQASWRVTGPGGRDAAISLGAGFKLSGIGRPRGFGEGQGMPAAHARLYTARAGIDQALAGGFGVQLDLSAQATPDTLPSYEQWVLGGWNALSAWLPGTLVGDRGYLGRLTVQAPTWSPGPLKAKLGVFAEHGTARYHYVPAGSPAWQRLSDAGASLTIDLPRPDAHALLAYAHPLGGSRAPYALRRRQRAHAFVYLQFGF